MQRKMEEFKPLRVSRSEHSFFIPLLSSYQIKNVQELRLLNGVDFVMRAILSVKGEEIQGKEYNGIVFIDCDEVMVKSGEFNEKKLSEPALIFPGILYQQLEEAKKAKLKIVCVTARNFSDEELLGNHPLSVLNVLNQLAVGCFSEIFFTNSKCNKLEILLWLMKECNIKEEMVCFLDDQENNLKPIHDAGLKIKTIHVKTPPTIEHLTELKGFIESRLLSMHRLKR